MPGPGPADSSAALHHDAARQLQRVTWAWAAALALLAALLCWLPLFHLLGFEFALALTLAVGPAAAHLGVRSPSWAAAARRSLLLLVPPLLLITLNALRVRNCNPLEGLRLYVLLTAAGAVVAAGWGRAAAVVWGARGRALAVVLGLGVVSALWAVARFLIDPQISVCGAAFGWWPGALYDEGLGVPGFLPWARLADLVGAAFALGGAHLWSALRRGDRLGPPAVVWGLAGVAALAMLGARVELGYHQDRATLERALGGHVVGGPLDLHFAAEAYDESEVRQLREDLEFRVHQLERFFGLAPASEPLRVYVYASRAQRRRLMGAHHVSIAKPWLAEVHLVRPSYGESIVTHELAHVVSARFGGAPLGMPARWGVVPLMGLVEGAAVAAEWQRGSLTPHGWAAALRRLDLAPDPAAILETSGFYHQAAGRAYTVAGSFARFLIDTEGAARFRAVYRHGDFVRAYGHPLSELVQRWERFVDGQPLSEADVELARLRFRRPAIFRRVCAREISRARDVARRLQDRGQRLEALALLGRVCAWEPGDPGHLSRLFDVQRDVGLFSDARWTGSQLLEHRAASATLKAQMLERLGDLDWGREQHAHAEASYAEALTLHPSEGQRRSLHIKLWALGQPALAESVRGYLTGTERVERDAALVTLALRTPPAGVAPAEQLYLVARALHLRRDWLGAVTQLDRALQAGLAPAALRDEAQRLRAVALFFAERTAEALAGFEALSHQAARPGLRSLAADWAQRCRWVAARRAVAGGSGSAALDTGTPLE